MTPGFKISSFNYKILPFNLQSWALLLKQDERDGHISQASLKHSSAPSRFPCSALSTPIASSSFALSESSLFPSLMSFSFLGGLWGISPRGSKGLKILSKTAWSFPLVAILFIEPRSQGIKALGPTPGGQSFTREGCPWFLVNPDFALKVPFFFHTCLFQSLYFKIDIVLCSQTIPLAAIDTSRERKSEQNGMVNARPVPVPSLSWAPSPSLSFSFPCLAPSAERVWKNSAFSRLWTIQLESIFLLFHLR